ncbi:DUF1622 domain-containing protein [Hymenobacter sp. NBH84]|uniref:DUF1622 domain-containing protein n=1 Tax=Hymenobacter sp. NBH84 TaxID=2596915 RepID=UPI001629860B|nr:DUF1622 domain-containing protein [Hymenobacter sp. NBH84]QNE39717.1 DUF1622 domain-containing protein [Hymenobacter sp. NBH84]
MIATPESLGVEGSVIAAVQWIKLAVEAIGAAIIALGVLIAGSQFVLALLRRQTANFNAIRLMLARYLAVALEFELGADVLSTAIAPGWEQIGKLGAIAVIRTALNYFLSIEMKEESASEQEKKVAAQASGSEGG